MIRQVSRLGGIISLLLWMAGCASHPTPSPIIRGSFHVSNVRGTEIWPAEIRRIAVLPIADATRSIPQSSLEQLNPIWIRALAASQRAEISPVDPIEYQRWTRQVNPSVSTDMLPNDLLQKIQTTTGADAVIFLDVTALRAYAPLALGLRPKLVRLKDAHLLWSADEFFDAADPRVARAAERFAEDARRGPGDPAINMTQSPSRFMAFATSALTDALPRHAVTQGE